MPLERMIELFDFPGVNKGNASFDLRKLTWLNAQYLMALDEDAFLRHCLPVLEKAGMPVADDGTTRRILSLIRTKISVASEIPERIAFFFAERCDYDPTAMDKLSDDAGGADSLETLRQHLARASAWTEAGIGEAIDQAAHALGVKKGKLMFPARVAASGSGTGPDLLPMLELLGRERVLARFDEAVSLLRNHG